MSSVARIFTAFLLLSLLDGNVLSAQQAQPADWTTREQFLLDRIDKLEKRLDAFEKASPVASTASNAAPSPAGPSPAAPARLQQSASTTTPADSVASPLAFSNGLTLNLNFDGYYGYNFNHPAGGINLLRSNDVTANNFSVNQAGLIFERQPDATKGQRLGFRLDLMFGQNTQTLQGSTLNEPRPQIYQNIFQAYGTYILPVGSGLQMDFGKFASSLGYEGNYTKDQFNYSRSFYFNFLPFYHNGLRATYNLNSKLALQYWLVNGANQTEDFNAFKSQAVLLTYKPSDRLSWSTNYYEGQEQREITPYNPGSPALPTQPGLSTDQTANLNGRFHVLDSYASFLLNPKWTVALEGDYVLNRVTSTSAPVRVFGGVGYLHHQLTKALAVNGRFGYLKDRGGLFSGATQDLKEITATGVYQVADGFQTKLEFRRDFSNRPFFLTNNPAVLAMGQNTATLGFVWWLGGKTGSW